MQAHCFTAPIQHIERIFRAIEYDSQAEVEVREHVVDISGGKTEYPAAQRGVRGGRQLRERVSATKPHRQLCRSPCLDRPSFSQSSTLPELSPDDTKAAAVLKHASDKEYQTKTEFALKLKLGYSGEQVETVLNKLGAAALINDILAELVRLGNKGEPEVQASVNTGTLVSRGGLCVKEAVSPEGVTGR
ncbi:unnamed protein product [Coregonus sp. 'balchen']|nr:unnamed protein product [Coregonus sp. 'balchen']